MRNRQVLPSPTTSIQAVKRFAMPPAFPRGIGKNLLNPSKAPVRLQWKKEIFDNFDILVLFFAKCALSFRPP